MNDLKQRFSVLFVCTANLCRSPMAAGIFAQMIAAEGRQDQWRIESAGTWGLAGLKAPPEVSKVMAERKIDLTNHRSRIIDAEMMQDYDLFLVMEVGHKEALRAEFPGAAGKIFLLAEMSGRRVSVGDPIGGGPKDFQDTAAEIAGLLLNGKARIFELTAVAHSA